MRSIFQVYDGVGVVAVVDVGDEVSDDVVASFGHLNNFRSVGCESS